jgi:hypothetical protein
VQVARNCHAGHGAGGFRRLLIDAGAVWQHRRHYRRHQQDLIGGEDHRPAHAGRASLKKRSSSRKRRPGRRSTAQSFPDGPMELVRGLQQWAFRWRVQSNRDLTGAFQRELCGNGAARYREYRRWRCRRYQHFLHANHPDVPTLERPDKGRTNRRFDFRLSDLSLECSQEVTGEEPDPPQTTERCRAMQVRSTSSIGFAHQASEKISISE